MSDLATIEKQLKKLGALELSQQYCEAHEATSRDQNLLRTLLLTTFLGTASSATFTYFLSTILPDSLPGPLEELLAFLISLVIFMALLYFILQRRMKN